MRQATKDDFKVGNKLFNEYGGWIIKAHYDVGVWEARSVGGRNEKCIFESEAKFYTVEN